MAAVGKRNMSGSDPTRKFTELGMSPRDAKGLMRALRHNVARMARHSALPVIALDPVTVEWIGHANRGMLGITIASRPNPDSFLRTYRDTHERGNTAGRLILEIAPAKFTGRVSSMFYQAISAGVPDWKARVRTVEWTGWALLAVMMALETHEHKIPFPDWKGDDRDNLYAEEAYRKGKALLVGGGLNLINEAEREAASL
jgi:hypothetical protein